RTAQLFKSLVQAQIFSIVKNIHTGSRIVANETLQQDFSLHHTLSLYLIEVLSVLDREHEDYALDILSLVEAIEENPMAILNRQTEIKKTEAMSRMKAEGLEFDERIEALDKIEYDKPVSEFIYATFNDFRKKHPWLEAENIHPKSIVRDMFLKGATFNQYVVELGLARSEGLLLRYLSQTYKTLVQSVPDNYKSDQLMDIIAYLKVMLSRVDTSLIDEWESLFKDSEEMVLVGREPSLAAFDPRINKKAFIAKIRAELFHLVRLLSERNFEEAALAIANSKDWPLEKWEESLNAYFSMHEKLIADARARSPELTRIKELSELEFDITHNLIDESDERDWFLRARIDMKDRVDDSAPLLTLLAIES
ncbi:MAG TPA: DUF3516 domain-containing protein, partial [Myxococcota bacterium]|nr:DUF3516 domain-containing protein [Myxococcota bacterium]